MEGLAFSEILVIILAIVILFGPNKIPQIARDLGSGVRKMKGAVEDIKTEIMRETDVPISEIKKEIQKAKDAAKEWEEKLLLENEKKEISETINYLSEDFEGPVSRKK